MGRCLLAMAALSVPACKRHDPRPEPEAVPTPPVPAQVDGGREGENSIAGSAGGTPFSQIAAAFVIENPESDLATVIYLLSKPVRCIDLSFAGWDRTITGGTLVLELKLLGKSPGTYLAVPSPTLFPGEGAAEWMRTSSDPPPIEVRSQGGEITVDSLDPRGSTTGSFTLEFGKDRLKGNFNAAFCTNGHEP
jgi:hypothetical protein